MTPTTRAQDWLHDMQAAAEQTLQFTAGMDLAAFLSDAVKQRAVFFNIIVLGEVSTRLMDASPALVARHPEIAWRAIRNMRNQVAHGYATIDLEVVWRTVTEVLPDLLAKLPAVYATAAQPPAADTSPPTAVS